MNWTVQLDAEGQPFFTFSALFPLVDHNPLESKAALHLKIPTYTDYQPAAEPLTVPATGQGFPLPTIPAEIDTLGRLTCWLGLIAYQSGDFIRYCNALQGKELGLPAYTVDVRGLNWVKPLAEAVLYSSPGISASTETNAAGAFADIEGSQSPAAPNNDYLAEKIQESRDNQTASEPQQTDPGQGYDRIDTLPTCADQDPKVKAFSKPLKELLK